jgi:hypothetical protein
MYACERLKHFVKQGLFCLSNSLLFRISSIYVLSEYERFIQTLKLPHNAVFTTILLFPLVWAQIFSSGPCSQTPSVCVLPLGRETKFHSRENENKNLLWVGRPGFASQKGQGLFFSSLPRPDRLWGPPSLLFNGGSGRDVKLTTHLHLVPRLRMYVFLAWCLVEHRNSFTFTVPYNAQVAGVE